MQGIVLMRTKLLTTTAVLLASIVMASAQSNPRGDATQAQGPGAAPGGGASPSGGAQDRGAQQGQDRGAQGKDAPAQTDRDKGKAQKGAQDKDAPAQTDRDKGKAQKGAQDKDAPAQTDRDKGKAQKGAQDKDAPAQTDRDKGKAQKGAQDKDAPAQTDRDKGKAQKGAQDKDGPAQTDRDKGKAGTMTTEQRTRVRETVINKGPKVTNVNFSVSVGTVVPRTVSLVVVPAVFVEIYPQYRGRKYFVYNEQIIIVDDDLKIIAVITV
jgi:hypothetical protein